MHSLASDYNHPPYNERMGLGLERGDWVPLSKGAKRWLEETGIELAWEKRPSPYAVSSKPERQVYVWGFTSPWTEVDARQIVGLALTLEAEDKNYRWLPAFAGVKRLEFCPYLKRALDLGSDGVLTQLALRALCGGTP